MILFMCSIIAPYYDLSVFRLNRSVLQRRSSSEGLPQSKGGRLSREKHLYKILTMLKVFILNNDIFDMANVV